MRTSDRGDAATMTAKRGRRRYPPKRYYLPPSGRMTDDDVAVATESMATVLGRHMAGASYDAVYAVVDEQLQALFVERFEVIRQAKGDADLRVQLGRAMDGMVVIQFTDGSESVILSRQTAAICHDAVETCLRDAKEAGHEGTAWQWAADELRMIFPMPVADRSEQSS